MTQVQEIIDPSRPSSHAHTRVRDTAVEMANELYDTMAGNNLWYAEWKKLHHGASGPALRRRFVAKNAPKLLKQARATIAHLITVTTDDKLKEECYEALLLDATLMRGRHQH